MKNKNIWCILIVFVIAQMIRIFSELSGKVTFLSGWLFQFSVLAIIVYVTTQVFKDGRDSFVVAIDSPRWKKTGNILVNIFAIFNFVIGIGCFLSIRDNYEAYKRILEKELGKTVDFQVFLYNYPNFLRGNSYFFIFGILLIFLGILFLMRNKWGYILILPIMIAAFLCGFYTWAIAIALIPQLIFFNSKVEIVKKK